MDCPFCQHHIDGPADFCPFCGCMLTNLVSPQPAPPSKVPGIFSMVLGILSLTASCLWPVAFAMATVGLILGCVSRSKAKKAGYTNKFATAGIIMTLIALIPTIIFLVVGIVSGSMFFLYAA